MPWINCTRSIENNQVRRYIPDALALFQSAFRETAIIDHSSFWDLTAEIINVPYEDLPLNDPMCGYEDRDSKIHVYRSNHDVAHGIRKLLYTIKLFTLLRADDRCKTYLDSMSTEENNLLYLLVFIERAGRTNEYGSSHDGTILKRTAEIFRAVARDQLKLTREMVNSFCKILEGNCGKRPNHMFTTQEEQFIQNKISFLHKCVITVHHIDLLRCRKTKHVKEWLFQDIRDITPLASQEQITGVQEQMISFAETLLFETGTNYDSINGNIYCDDTRKKAACVSNPGSRLQELFSLISAPSPDVLATQPLPVMGDQEIAHLLRP